MDVVCLEHADAELNFLKLIKKVVADLLGLECAFLQIIASLANVSAYGHEKEEQVASGTVFLQRPIAGLLEARYSRIFLLKDKGGAVLRIVLVANEDCLVSLFLKLVEDVIGEHAC